VRLRRRGTAGAQRLDRRGARALLELLRDKAVDGFLPPWTDWWDEADVAPMFPDAATRAVVTAEQPRMPLSYYEQRIPVADGWDDDRPCGYVLFSSAYDSTAADARERGWAVETVRGEHLHQIVDPGTVAATVRDLADRLLITGPCPG
jgi:hypothetical protein